MRAKLKIRKTSQKLAGRDLVRGDRGQGLVFSVWIERSEPSK